MFFFRLPDIALRSVGRSYGWHTQGQTLKSPEVTFYANCNILLQKKVGTILLCYVWLEKMQLLP